MEKLGNSIIRFSETVIVILVTFLLLKVIKNYLIKKVAYTKNSEQHKNTLIGVGLNVVQYLVLLGAIFTILWIYGINITGIFAGLGIVATIVGLSLQDTLKDILSGINIYNNNFYKVGDTVMYNGELCEVKYFNARVTKFQSMYTSSTYTVCNSCINTIEKVKDRTIIRITFPFAEDKEKIDTAFNNACKNVKAIKDVRDMIYAGVVDINEKGTTYATLLSTPAHLKVNLRSAAMSALFDEFKKAGVAPINEYRYEIEETKPKAKAKTKAVSKTK